MKTIGGAFRRGEKEVEIRDIAETDVADFPKIIMRNLFVEDDGGSEIISNKQLRIQKNGHAIEDRFLMHM
jgi:hypothetical protein